MPDFGCIAPRCGLPRSETSTSNERRNASHLRKPHNVATRSIHDGDGKDSLVPSVLGGRIPQKSSLALGLANAEDQGRQLDIELRQQKQVPAPSVLSETSAPSVDQARRLASFSQPSISASPGHKRAAAMMASPLCEPMSATPAFGRSGEGRALRGETTPDPALSCPASVPTARTRAKAMNAAATVPAAAAAGSGGANVATAVRGYDIGRIMLSNNTVSGDGGDAGGGDPSILEDEQLSPRKEDNGREQDGGGRGEARGDCPAVVGSDGRACFRLSSGRYDDTNNGCWEDTDHNSNNTWATNGNVSFATSTGSFSTMDSNTRGGGGGSPRSRVLEAALGAAARRGVAAAGEEGVLGGSYRVALRCAKTGADLASRVHDFLASDRKVFLLSGEAGSGKSLFVTLLAHELALACSRNQGGGRTEAAGAGEGARGGFLPIVIDAREAEGEHGMPLDGMVKHYLMSQLRLTKREVSTIRKKQRLLVIVDGFDRISADKLVLVKVCRWQTQGKRFMSFSK
ncbi:unnamed protein product, partial [Ectocarpus fasciculatus]